ncbi:MAG: enoyl-CoA hydratase/isomerase family protein [Sphingomonadaceae bacterium]|nr:enoyl-CoA hydratase/isomerase family protein [Sphingomonadaceae bacterium]
MTGLVIEETIGAVRLIRLNRPEARNAFNEALLSSLAAALQRAANDDAIRCTVVTGNEQAFGAGGDIPEMAATSPVGIWRSERHKWWATIHDFPKPLIAAVNGLALGGGCEFALAADIVVAGDNARFGLPEIKLGFVPGRGGTQRLPLAVGKPLAMWMILTGQTMDAARALQAGLVLEICPLAEMLPRALAIAAMIAEQPPVAAQIAKSLVKRSASPGLQDGMMAERHGYEFLLGTADAQEGMAAFIERRPPVFTGN